MRISGNFGLFNIENDATPTNDCLAAAGNEFILASKNSYSIDIQGSGEQPTHGQILVLARRTSLEFVDNGGSARRLVVYINGSREQFLGPCLPMYRSLGGHHIPGNRSCTSYVVDNGTRIESPI